MASLTKDEPMLLDRLNFYSTELHSIPEKAAVSVYSIHGARTLNMCTPRSIESHPMLHVLFLAAALSL